MVIPGGPGGELTTPARPGTPGQEVSPQDTHRLGVENPEAPRLPSTPTPSLGGTEGAWLPRLGHGGRGCWMWAAGRAGARAGSRPSAVCPPRPTFSSLHRPGEEAVRGLFSWLHIKEQSAGWEALRKQKTHVPARGALPSPLPLPRTKAAWLREGGPDPGLGGGAGAPPSQMQEQGTARPAQQWVGLGPVPGRRPSGTWQRLGGREVGAAFVFQALEFSLS